MSNRGRWGPCLVGWAAGGLGSWWAGIARIWPEGVVRGRVPFRRWLMGGAVRGLGGSGDGPRRA